MERKRMGVRAVIGGILVAWACATAALRAADAATTLPEEVRGFSGRVRGIVQAKGEDVTFTFQVGRLLDVWKGNQAANPEAIVGLTVTVGPGGEKGGDGEWRPAELHVAFIGTLKAGAELTLEIVNREGAAFSILELSREQRELAEAAMPREGVVTGILTAKGETWIEVKGQGESWPRRYQPVWLPGGEGGGGLDKDMLAAIRKLTVSNLVRVAWKRQEGRRIVAVGMLLPETKEGLVEGVVVAKGDGWIDVAPEGGLVERYMPRWIGGMPENGGGLDKDMLRAIEGVKVGDTVRLRWVYDERKRVVALEVTARRSDAAG